MTDYCIRFGEHELNLKTRQLLRSGQEITLGARAFDLLVALAQRSGRVVSKRELMSLVWPTTVVEEANLRVGMSAIRKELGPELITTIPGRGYQFTARIEADLTISARPADAQGVATPTPTPAATFAHSLIGRDALLDQVRTGLETARLLTLTGHSGSGKTSLARAVLMTEPHCTPTAMAAVHWVDLAALSDGELLAASIAQASDVTLGNGAGLKDLVAALRASQALLILDNAEHLVDAVAAIAYQLLEGCPQLRLLVTSQIRLKLAGEIVLLVPPLDAACVGTEFGIAQHWPAQALFLRHCQQAGRPLAIDQRTLDLVGDICLRLDGVPLAIEFAAAAVPLLGLQGVASSLEQRRLVLSAGRRDAPKRHKTLRAALEWSVSLLGPFEQLVFRRLGVFAGGCSMALLDPVVNVEGEDPWRLMEAISELIDRSLVVPEDGLSPRYRLLESSRAFAIERLNECDEISVLRARHAKALEHLYGQARDSALHGELCVDAAVDLLQTEIGNARAAFQWALEHDSTLAVSLAASLAFLMRRTRGLGEAARYLTQMEPLAEMAPTDALHGGWVREAILHWTYTDNPRAQRWIGIAEAAHRHANNAHGLFETLSLKANCIDQAQGDSAVLAEVLDEVRTLDVPTLPNRLRTFGATAILLAAQRLGRDDDLRWVENCAADCPPGDEHGRMILVCRLMGIQLARGRAKEAVDLGEPLYARLRVGKYRHALLPISLVHAHLLTNDIARAAAIASDCFESDMGNGFIYVWGDALAHMACHSGQYQKAAQMNGYADGCYAATGGARGEVENHFREVSQASAQQFLGQQAYCAAREAGARWSQDTMRTVILHLLRSLRTQRQEVELIEVRLQG